MKVTLKTIDSIKAYENNPRINDGAVDAVAASLEQFGFRQPIVVDEAGVIICGHTRYKAAVKLGLEKVPVHVAKDLSPEQVKAYRLADNKTSEMAEWDFEILPIEIADLQNVGFDLAGFGFSDKELTQLLDSAGGVQQGLTDPDAVPAPPDEAVSKPGEIYQLGNHLLMCGDSANPADLDKLLAGKPIHLVNTDPPYNVRVEPRSNNAIAAGMSNPLPHLPKSGKLKSSQTHHQKLDVQRHPEKSQATHKKLRAKDRPLI